jgi:5'-AMP-activated protein kinase, regulatory beta subunit
MGNAGSNQPKDWHREAVTKAPDQGPSSPIKEGEAFTFDKKFDDVRGGRDEDNAIEDGAPYYTKAVPESEEEYNVPRGRSNTLTESSRDIDDLKVLPTVFKWEGGGKQVILTFNRFHAAAVILRITG